MATHSAFDEGVRALLSGPEGIEVHGVVADALETGSEHERALEAFLGDRLQAVLVPDAEQARRGIRWLQSSGAGRGAFLPLASARTRHDCGPLREIAAQEPKSLGLLSDFYRVGGAHAERIRASLPDAIVVATLEDALEVASRQGPVAVVTLEGETLRGAMVEGGRDVKGLLAPRREVKEVAARQEEMEGRLLALRSAAAETAGIASAAAAEARSLEERIHAAEKDLVAVRHEVQTAEEESSRLHRKASILDTERSQAEQERAAAALRLAEIEQALGSAEAEREEGHRRLAEIAVAVAEGRAATEAAQARHAEARSSLAALRERTAAAQNECRRLEGDLAELEQRIAAARTHAEETAARRGGLETELGRGRAAPGRVAARPRPRTGRDRCGRGPRARGPRRDRGPGAGPEGTPARVLRPARRPRRGGRRAGPDRVRPRPPRPRVPAVRGHGGGRGGGEPHRRGPGP